MSRSHIFAVVEAFKGYDNTLAFFAGNEVVNDAESAEVSPRYVKAVIRDLKQYIAGHLSRQIPVGYSAADDLRVYPQNLHTNFSIGSNCRNTSPVAKTLSIFMASTHINVKSI
jgi:hypothetical protein